MKLMSCCAENHQRNTPHKSLADYADNPQNDKTALTSNYLSFSAK